uniref:Glutaredoxin domain-containing protein n=1 Tax=Ananas comosus var. bracteatus TaxID=296719 RepID=A0A6V7QET0_ANACO|nr:unnamed protein product [Ananas comosus var. bracteatus]
MSTLARESRLFRVSLGFNKLKRKRKRERERERERERGGEDEQIEGEDPPHPQIHPTRGVYDPPPTTTTTTKLQQQQTTGADDDADDLFFFDAPPSPDSILNPKTDPSSSPSSYVLVHLPDSPQPIAAAAAAEPNPSSSDDEDDDDREEEEEEEEEEEDLLRGFEVRCPPGGEEAVIVYTTSLRGIRKTFEDCGRVRLLLRSLGAAFHERDVAMDAGTGTSSAASSGGARRRRGCS